MTVVGCWRPTGGAWVTAPPVRVNGMTLAGGKGVVVDERRGTITSRGRVRWLLGAVQVRNAPFAWKRGARLTVPLGGALRGLAFQGDGTIAFTPAKGGTTRLATAVRIPLVAGGLSGAVTLTVSRKAGLDLTQLHVMVPQAPLSRLVFQQLDFRYDQQGARWFGTGKVTLPAFTPAGVTISGHVGVANGKLVDVGAGLDGVQIPLADGFFLTGAAFSAGLDPFGLAGRASVTFGPPLGSGAALKLEGRGSYVGQPESWTASGTLTLPWLPQFAPKVDGTVTLRAGRAVVFDAGVDLTIHGWGLSSDLQGFVSKRAFNAEGDASLSIPGPDLHGSGLFSSKGMAACGKIFFGPHVGFGYSWGGALDFMHSSCDIGPWRVNQVMPMSLARAAAPAPITVGSGEPFEVFAARGSDFTVTGPAGAISSTPDRNGPDAFVTHDTTDGWAYVVVPVPPAGVYTLAAMGTGTIAEANAADGLTDPTIAGTVTGTGDKRTLQYGIGGLVPGETVSLYQGQSSTAAGAEPIAEDLAGDSSGSNAASVQFTPEALGQSTRYIYAVVSIDGRPREQALVTSFDSQETPPPASLVRISRDPADTEWIVNYAESGNVAEWQAIVSTGNSPRITRTAATLPSVPPFQTAFPTKSGTHLTVRMTPYDAFGRAGTPVLCDSASPGLCPPAPPESG